MSTGSTNRIGVLKLWLLNFVANAAVLAVWYLWLIIPDAHGWQVAGSALIALIVVVSVLWLRAGTLAWFRIAEFRDQRRIWIAYRHAWRHVLALGVWVLVFAVLAWILWGLYGYVPQFAVWLRQKLGGGPTPRNIMRDVSWLLLLIGLFVLPGLWVPMATTISAVGFKAEHIVQSRRVWRRAIYWLWFCILLGASVYIPYKLVWWIPDLQALRQQAWSMVGRFLLAYIIGVTGFIAVVWVAALHTDREDPITIEGSR
jgi:hypothetical protein